MSFARTRPFQSESFRHAAIYAGLFAVSMIVLTALVYVTMDRAFRADLLRASTDDLTSIQKAYVAGLPRHRGVHEAREMIEDRMLAPDDQDRFLLQSGASERLEGNMAPMTPRSGVFSLNEKINGVTHEILGRGVLLAPGVYAFVGRDTAGARATEQQVLRDFAWILLGSILLAAVSGLVLARSFLRRIDAISGTCRSIMAGRLGERIPAGKGKTELERLAQTINGMLDRIQVLMESLKQVSNDIAHDMRTPLAHLRYSLERAKNGTATPEQYRAAIQSAIAESDQLLEMFAALLRIAQIEAGAQRDGFEQVELGQVLRRAYDIYKPVMEEGARPFAIEAQEGARAAGDPQLLLQMVANLLDNAAAHTPAGTPVRALVKTDAGGSAIIVADEGPGIPVEDREKIFRRFYRREQSRTSPGSGLGLSLVAVIAGLHGAQIQTEDNAPGFRVAIRFPSA
jgi:signal transduction histidine kinase